MVTASGCIMGNEEIVYIPISSTLSNSYRTARLLAEGYRGDQKSVPTAFLLF
ncbi:MAG: hypothetical protein MR523_11865 [Lachnospiraceae bacterium]|nr:hypothetical protein [Lachnospiraceae bacterium]